MINPGRPLKKVEIECAQCGGREWVYRQRGAAGRHELFTPLICDQCRQGNINTVGGMNGSID